MLKIIKKTAISILTILLLISLINITQANDLNCEIKPTNECDQENTILKLKSEYGIGHNNSHAELRDYADPGYPHSLCCTAGTQEIKTDCADEKTIEILRLFNQTNSHVQYAQNYTQTTNYTHQVCLGGTNNITCETINGACQENFECIASIASSEYNEGYNNLTNAHMAACNYYSLNICCQLGFALDTPTLIYPENEDEFFVNRTPNFNWTDITNPIAGPIMYEFQLSKNEQFTTLIYDEDITTNSNYQITAPLNFSQYYWRVRAYNTEIYSEWSNTSNFTLIEQLMIELTTSTINFGTLNLEDIKNTTTNNPQPFTFKNIGNINANLNNITATNLWQSPNAGLNTHYFQIKARATDSYDVLNSITSWTNISTQIQNLIMNLNWTGQNEAQTDIAIRVPSQEPPGTKETNLTFTWGVAS
ncbi:MAG: hypothetical protein ACLFN8_04300 [Candidatus Woesearchaeota archaeon]